MTESVYSATGVWETVDSETEDCVNSPRPLSTGTYREVNQVPDTDASPSTPALDHGKAHTYRHYKCRCDACTAAAVDDVDKYRKRTREKARYERYQLLEKLRTERVEPENVRTYGVSPTGFDRDAAIARAAAAMAGDPTPRRTTRV
jgi:hypothetical protein